MAKPTKLAYAHFRIDIEMKTKATSLQIPISKTCRNAIKKEIKKKETRKVA